MSVCSKLSKNLLWRLLQIQLRRTSTQLSGCRRLSCSSVIDETHSSSEDDGADNLINSSQETDKDNFAKNNSQGLGRSLRNSLILVNQGDLDRSGRQDLGVEDDSLSVIDKTDTSLIDSCDFSRLPPKCSSCGAIFQSFHVDKPGFLTQEKISLLGKDYNRSNHLSIRGENTIICQPCFTLRHRNKRILLPQDKESVLTHLAHMPRTRALILYVVDLFDMYGTLIPDLSNIIGKRKHIILVGNKIDKFATGTYTTGGKQMIYLKDSLLAAAKQFSHTDFNIVDTCLISASYGYGIEELVTKINKYRDHRNHIYIVGGNNSGKSTLFNTLQNFMNLLTKKKPLPAQAIVHHTPGSTYSLVRHPIGKRTLHSLRSLFFQPPEIEKEEEEPVLGLADDLVAELGLRKNISKLDGIKDTVKKARKETALVKNHVELVDKNSEGTNPLYMYDTPGIPNSEQLLQFLTPDEMQLLKQTLWVVPETRLLNPGQVLLIGGLVRIDYDEVSRPSKKDIAEFEEVPKASRSIFFTTFMARNIPRHITNIDRADEVYADHLGGDLLKIPFGSEERLKSFPKLEPLEYTIIGCGWDKSAKDIVINGLGWISITAGYFSHVKIKVYTPLGIGQYLREKPLMPEAIKRRGERGARYLGRSNKQIYESTRRRNPALTDHLDKKNETTKELLKLVKAKKKNDKLCIAHERQQQRLEQGVVLGAFKRIGKLEKLLEDNIRQAITDGNQDSNHKNDE